MSNFTLILLDKTHHNFFYQKQVWYIYKYYFNTDIRFKKTSVIFCLLFSLIVKILFRTFAKHNKSTSTKLWWKQLKNNWAKTKKIGQKIKLNICWAWRPSIQSSSLHIRQNFAFFQWAKPYSIVNHGETELKMLWLFHIFFIWKKYEVSVYDKYLPNRRVRERKTLYTTN